MALERDIQVPYRDHRARDAATHLLLAAGLLLFASLVTGAWALLALIDAGWLHENDLFAGEPALWGSCSSGWRPCRASAACWSCSTGPWAR